MDAQSGWLHTAIVFHSRGTAEGGHGGVSRYVVIVGED